MKKLISFRMGAIYILAVVAALVSCSKPKNDDPKPNTNPSLPKPGLPYIQFAVSGDTSNGKVYYGGNINFAITSNGVVKMNGNSEVNNPIVFSSVVNPVTFQLTSRIAATSTHQQSDEATLDVAYPMHTQKMSNKCWNKTWHNDTTMSSNDLLSPTETPTSWTKLNGYEAGQSFQFSTNGTAKIIMTGGPTPGTFPFTWQFLNNETQVKYGNNPPKDIESLTKTRAVYTWIEKWTFTNPAGLPEDRFTKYISIYK